MQLQDWQNLKSAGSVWGEPPQEFLIDHWSHYFYTDLVLLSKETFFP